VSEPEYKWCLKFKGWREFLCLKEHAWEQEGENYTEKFMIVNCIKHCQTDRVKDAEADVVRKLQGKSKKGIQNVCSGGSERKAHLENQGTKGQDKIKVLLK
jgi:hypothetical protein